MRALYPAALLGGQEERAALAAALVAAPWGRQPDGTFVTRSCGWQGSIATSALSIARGVVVATVEHRDEPRLVALDWPETAELFAAERTAKRRTWEASYLAARRCAAGKLRQGHTLPFEPGQNYGRVWIRGAWVSARGALVAAGLCRAEAEAILGDPEEHEGQTTLSIREGARMQRGTSGGRW